MDSGFRRNDIRNLDFIACFCTLKLSQLDIIGIISYYQICLRAMLVLILFFILLAAYCFLKKQANKMKDLIFTNKFRRLQPLNPGCA